jgi:hypothetical protein
MVRFPASVPNDCASCSPVSAEYNQRAHLLYVDIRQLFTYFFLPIYTADVRLTTKLRLVPNAENNKFYIASQEDLYQTNEVVKFLCPGGATVLWFAQLLATMLCILGVWLLAPMVRLVRSLRVSTTERRKSA